jgi:hypothetical protein
MLNKSVTAMVNKKPTIVGRSTPLIAAAAARTTAEAAWMKGSSSRDTRLPACRVLSEFESWGALATISSAVTSVPVRERRQRRPTPRVDEFEWLARLAFSWLAEPSRVKSVLA